VNLNVFSFSEGTTTKSGVHHPTPVGLTNHKSNGSHLLLLPPFNDVRPAHLQNQQKTMPLAVKLAEVLTLFFPGSSGASFISSRPSQSSIERLSLFLLLFLMPSNLAAEK